MKSKKHWAQFLMTNLDGHLNLLPNKLKEIGTFRV